MKPTFEPCANFGHNFFRTSSKPGEPEIIKCKHCSIEVHVNNEGDFVGAPESKLAIHQMMKRLFLLRTTHFRYLKRRGFSLGNI